MASRAHAVAYNRLLLRRGTMRLSHRRQPLPVNEGLPLSLCTGLPEVRFAPGDLLIEEGVRTDRLYVLKSGAFEVIRNGVRIVLIDEPGSFLGEISALLGSAPTASAVATRDSAVHVIEKASAAVQRDPQLTYAIARLLARRLSAVTAYLVDIKRQYADSNTHLALMWRSIRAR
jgi:CRP/FNR family cyclic AMP-dependent transcriptional regulator